MGSGVGQVCLQVAAQCNVRRSVGIELKDIPAFYAQKMGTEFEHRMRLYGKAHAPFELKKGNFSKTGNFGFGIQEHIDLNIKYDPTTGIYGMDFFVVVGRQGFRVARRKTRKGRVGLNQKLTKEDTMKWFCQKFEGIVM